MDKYTKYLFFILLAKAVTLIFILRFLGLALSPDEAQYWTWSQDLDFGYYSKPPGIAWQIFVTTSFLGNNEWGVRFGALVLGFLIAYAIYFLGNQCSLSKKASFWAALLFAFSPLGFYLSFAATTDAGCILGITLALGLIAHGLYEKKAPNYFLIGLAIFFGALFKWVAFVIYPFLFCLLFFYPWMRRKSLIFGLLISMVALLPSVYWNFFHDFATFKHVFYTMFNAKGTSKEGNFFSFLGSQIILLSPLTFLLFIVALWKPKENQALRFLTFFSSGFLIYVLLSVSKKMQPNWAIFFYPSGMVLASWYGCEVLKRGMRWVAWAFSVSLLCSLFAFIIPLTSLPYQWNPFRQTLGWPQLQNILASYEYQPKEHILLADTYQMTSLLSFYSEEKHRAYFFNLKGNRKNQFSYWPRFTWAEKKVAFFVLSENISREDDWYRTHYLQKLEKYFAKVQYLGSDVLYQSEEKPLKRTFIFRCENFLGKFPVEPQLY